MFLLKNLTQLVFCLDKSEELHKIQNRMNQRIQEMKKNFGIQMMAFPDIKYSLKGENYSLAFTVDSRRGTLPDIQKEIEGGLGCKVVSRESSKVGNMNLFNYKLEDSQGEFTISLIGPANSYFYLFEYTKSSDFTQDIDRFTSLFKIANQSKAPSSLTKKPPSPHKESVQGDPMTNLQELGARVYKVEDAYYDWDYLAGSEASRREIEDTILLTLERPDILDKITDNTRVKPEKNRPKAVLFEGPPGTGKTTSAKIISHQVKIPLVYVRLETLMSKYYGEAEKNLGKIFENCISLGKCMIFIDEIDSLAQSRDKDMHEATRRVLSVFLRYLDGFESSDEVIVICATNRKDDLDPALQSRFSKVIKFENPDRYSREAIFARYAKQLDGGELKVLADKSAGLAGRDIRNVCEDAERRWAAFVLRGESDEFKVPFQLYLASLENRKSVKGL